MKEIKIGNQVWMAENLNIFSFRNGDPVPIVKTNEEWINARISKQPACCYYNNTYENGKKYGLLYNWYAVNDSRGLVPEGWHIPSYKEWNKLTIFSGGKGVVGTKLKNTDGWDSYQKNIECTICKEWTPQQKAGQICTTCNDTRKVKGDFSGNGSNSFGFSGLPGGYRHPNGNFYEIGKCCKWWSLNANWWGSIIYISDRLQTWGTELYDVSDDLRLKRFNKGQGLSVRCIRD